MKFTIGNLSSGVAAPPTPDPYFQYVVLLGGFNGSNGQTTFTDESAYAHTLTAAGTAQVSTTSPKFGTGALLLAASDSVDTPTSNDWDLAALDFTVEGWVKFDNVANASFLGRATGGSTSWQFFFESNSLRWNNYGPSVTQIFETTNAWTPTVGQWYYVVAERNGTTYRLYRDGAMVAKFTGVTGAISTGALPLKIGVGFQFAAPHLDEWRVTKGVARYASDAGCPVPTAAFPRNGPPWFLTGPTASGNTWVGQVLTLTETDNATSRTYQWKRNGSAISGATATIYTLVSGDIGTTITCTVTLTNAYGTATTTSNALGPITATNPTAAIRGVKTAIMTNASTFSLTLPPGTQAGDYMVMVVPATSYVNVYPSGFTLQNFLSSGSYYGSIWTKVLTSGDISAGFITATMGGNCYGFAQGVVFVGGTGGYRDLGQTIHSAGGSSGTATTAGTATQVADNVLLFGGAVNATAASSSSLTNTLDNTISANGASIIRYGLATVAGAQSGTVNYTGSTGDYEAIIVIAP